MCVCLTASLLRLVPLQVCRRNGAGRQGFQPVHRLTAKHIPRASVELCFQISTREIKTFSFTCADYFLFRVEKLALIVTTVGTTGRHYQSEVCTQLLMQCFFFVFSPFCIVDTD